MKVAYINLHGDTNITAAYLHALIKKNGFDIKTIHFRRLTEKIVVPSNEELTTLRKAVDRINPEVVMMSVNSISFWTAIKVSEALSNRIIVWGGVQPLIDPERCLKYANIILRGEADEAIIELLNAIEQKKSISKIKNVWIKQDKKIIKNDFRALIKNLDSLSFPDFSDKDKLYIIGDRISFTNPLPHAKYEYNIAFSRGCPFSCKYCLNHLLNRMFKHQYLRKRSINSVIKELIIAKKTKPQLKFINFWDDVFLTDTIWLRQFVKEYKKHIGIPFFAYGHAKFVTKENVDLLEAAGIKLFDLGIQSGSERIRTKIFGRIDTNEDILRADKIIHRPGIRLAYDIIISEFETEKDMEESIKFMLKLKKPFGVNVNRLAYYLNFDITEQALQEKKITQDSIASVNPKIGTQIITREEAEKNVLTNFYYLLGNKLIPNSFLNFMLKNKWHKKHPKFVIRFGAMVNRIKQSKYPIKNMFNMLFKGEFKYLYNRIFNKKYLPPSY